MGGQGFAGISHAKLMLRVIGIGVGVVWLAGLRAVAGAAMVMTLGGMALGQDNDPQLVGELMAFHGSAAIVSAMTSHCYETTGLDSAYETAGDNWYLRNVGFLELADRVIDRLGGGVPGQLEAAETYGGTQIMSAYNQAGDKDTFCRKFLGEVESGALDIDKQLAAPLKRAQEIASQ
ncbi:hypothetical protein [uncultured Devosia sp.]|uniref:hypothetical protein n=1 Tax=uncultured Devosia sp. TaxID=211434 RepID=UPI0035C9D74B